MVEPVVSFTMPNIIIEPRFWQTLAEFKLDFLRLETPILRVCATADCSRRNGVGPIRVDRQCLLRTNDCSVEKDKRRPYEQLWEGRLLNVNSLAEFKTCDRQGLLDGLFEELVESGHGRSFVMLSYLDLKNHYVYYSIACPAMRSVEILQSVDVEMSKLSTEVQESHRDELICQGFVQLEDADSSLKKVKLVAFLDSVDCSRATDIGWFAQTVLAKIIMSEKEKNTTTETLALIVLRGGGRPSINLTCAITRSGETYRRIEGWKSFLVKPSSSSSLVKTSTVDRLCLRHFLDQRKIGADAVELNVKLIKWRTVPEFDPDKMFGCKSLLIGAGTLGSGIARGLLAWGCRTITFVDNGFVALSNPVRQSLYVFQDAVKGSRKVDAAAEAVRAIRPDVDCRGVHLDIPMPGRASSAEQVQEALEAGSKLEQLIEAHDAVFVCTDSRESRWLPSHLVARRNSRVSTQRKAEDSFCMGISVAIGFDSFLVMHSSLSLGCYFCNDCFPPSDSVTFRALDQQCTVTRPGVSACAAAIAVETAASLLQTNVCLGKQPQVIRGFLSSFTLSTMENEKASHCTCCSSAVINSAEMSSTEFYQRAFMDPRFLEEISGLKQYNENMATKIDLAMREGQLLPADEDDWQ